MNISDLLTQGLDLMVLGMGMVFFILGLLVIVIKALSALIMKYEPVAVADSVKTPQPSQIDENIVAAISIAVQRFRSN
ncbi:MAG: OadG family transporter subunit [Cycloclasticus sp.]|nr:OadG family transporter subunit [Cycloclasticus sp.]